MDEKLVEAKFSKLNVWNGILYFLALGLTVTAFFCSFYIRGDEYFYGFNRIVTDYYWLKVTVYVLVGAVIFLVLAILLTKSHPSLVIYEDRILGKTLFGKKIVLPISQVSSVGRGAFKNVTVATSSGRIIFFSVVNASEVVDVVLKLITKRQEETKTVVTKENNSIDQIKELKELLDMGAITQEEFDIKKKQILGL